MAVLPTGPDLSNGVTFQQQPSLTWYLDTVTGRIQGTADGYAAVCQAVEIILDTTRFRWQIYRPYSGIQWDGLIGQDPGYVAAELQRRVTEALLMDDRITAVQDFNYTLSGDVLTANLTARTVYGDVQTMVEVNLA